MICGHAARHHSVNGNNRIQKFSSDGTFLTQWGSAGTGVSQFSNPLGIAVDSSGNVYVADSGNRRIQKFKLQNHREHRGHRGKQTSSL
ncbi:MAG: hypothetical protein Q7J35_16510 [Candidatus Methanoperedens sp.]|nr:hypothetical protein [Candidatus Methanoperedens sp.]